MSNTKRIVEGKWEDAIPEPYYPGLVERVLHRLGMHVYPYQGDRKCLYPGCKKRIQPEPTND